MLRHVANDAIGSNLLNLNPTELVSGDQNKIYPVADNMLRVESAKIGHIPRRDVGFVSMTLPVILDVSGWVYDNDIAGATAVRLISE